MARDYRAEYERRRALREERTRRETESQAQAEAKRSLSTLKAALRRLIRETNYGVDLDEYRLLVMDGVERLGGDAQAYAFMVNRLRTKRADTREFTARVAEGASYRDAALGPPPAHGHTVYYGNRVSYLPVEVYWYHPA